MASSLVGIGPIESIGPMEPTCCILMLKPMRFFTEWLGALLELSCKWAEGRFLWRNLSRFLALQIGVWQVPRLRRTGFV